jgi:putative Ig domain-containing protein
MKSMSAGTSCGADTQCAAKISWTYNRLSIAPVLLLAALTTSCALVGFSKGAPPPQITISVSPATPTISSSDTQQFTATVSNTSNTAVTWSATAGTISATGMFTAPAVTSTTYVTVTATSQADPTKQAGATAIVTPPPSNVSISIAPVVVTLISGATQQFSATVRNTSNTAVSWAASAGTITTGGLYTAPNVSSELGVTVVATSQADASKSSSAAVHVYPPGTLSVQTSSLPQATGGTPYSTTLSATGGQTPYTWSISGTLPVGIQLNASTGVLSGTTDAWGSFTLTVTVTDAASNSANRQLTLTAVTPQSGPTKIPATFFGLQSLPVNGTYPTVSFGSYRLWDMQVAWATLNPASGTYSWGNLDGMLAQLRNNGVRDGINYTFGVVPTWASSVPADTACDFGSPGGCDLPADLNPDGTGTDATFIAFVQSIAEHVNDPTYLQTHAHIKYWEPWNEWHRNPILGKYFATCNTAGGGGCSIIATYAQMVRMTEDMRCVITGTGSVNGTPCSRTAIDPNAKIVAPDTYARAQYGVTLMENFLHCDKSPYAGSQCTTGDRGRNAIDILNFHFYALNTETAEEVNNDIGYIRTTIRSTDLSALPLWDNEGGWGMNTGLPDPDLQAAFVVRYYVLGWSNKISVMMWYEFENKLWGTLYARPADTLTLAGIAYQRVHDWTVGNRMTQACTGPAFPGVGVWTCGFAKQDGTHMLAVWDSSQSCSSGVCSTSLYTPNPMYISYVTLDNPTPVTIQGNMPIGAKPILLLQ